MVTKTFLYKAASFGIFAASALLNAQSALAVVYNTTFSGLSGLPNNIDEAVFDWQTNVNSGTVTPSDLTDWSIDLNSGGSTIYTDNVIVSGSVQPIGGVSRSLSGLFFEYDFGSSTLTGWDNDEPIVQDGAATGTTYNVFGISSIIVSEYNDGTFLSESNSTFSQSTTVASAAVPFEFSPAFGLLTIGGIWGVNYLRKRRSSLDI